MKSLTTKFKKNVFTKKNIKYQVNLDFVRMTNNSK